MALSAAEQAEMAQLEKEVGGSGTGGLSPSEQAEMAQLEKEVGGSMPTAGKKDYMAMAQLGPRANALKGMLNGQFGDTGRTAGSPGEYLDSLIGAPVRTTMNEMAVKGQNLVPAIKAGAGSFMKDPQNAPTGVDIAFGSGIKNPYAGAALGTLIDVGAQLPLAEAIPAGAKAASRGSEYLGNALKDIAETRAFKALGPVKHFEDANQAKGLINSIGRTALDEGVVTPLASKKTMLSRAQDLADQRENDLVGLIKQASEGKGLTPKQIQSVNESRFNPAQAGETLKQKLRSDYSELPEEAIEPRIGQIDQFLSKDEPLDIGRAQNMKRQISKFIKDPSYWKNPNASQEGLLNIRRAVKEGIEKNADAYANALGEEGGAVKGTNRQLGNAEEMQNILEDRISRNAANRSISASDYFTGLLGEKAAEGAVGHAAGPMGLLAIPIHKFAREKGSQLMATGADAASKVLLNNPGLLKLSESNPGLVSEIASGIGRQSGEVPAALRAADYDEKKKIKMAH